MDYYKVLKSDGSTVSDYLRSLVCHERSLAAVVRSIRKIEGYETTSIDDLINWIAGEDKDQSIEVWCRLLGLPGTEGGAHPELVASERKLQVLKDTRRLLRRIAGGRGASLHVIILQINALTTVIAEQRHENLMKRRTSR